jgi:hypothetical protein
MFNRRSTLLALGVGLTALTGLLPEGMPQAEASSPPSLSLDLSVPRGRRNTWVTLSARVTLYGQPCPNVPVDFYEEWGGRRIYLGRGVTNRSGVAVCPYLIPGNPNKDNVYIRASSASPSFRNASQLVRVPIG